VKKKILCIPILAALSMSVHAQSLMLPSLSLEKANTLAADAVKSCKEKGYNVSVTIVDASGITRAVQRMDSAGPHTVSASYQKAYTAASSGMSTRQLLENSDKYPAAKNLGDISGFLLLAGGVPVKVNNQVIGAIGIGGAPGGDIDEACALDAIRAMK